jgi:hypothetical protein
MHSFLYPATLQYIGLHFALSWLASSEIHENFAVVGGCIFESVKVVAVVTEALENHEKRVYLRGSIF